MKLQILIYFCSYLLTILAPLSQCTAIKYDDLIRNKRNSTDNDGIELDAEQSDTSTPESIINPKELLQVKLINNTVNYYKTQFKKVRTDIQGQLKEMINQGKNLKLKSKFSPELQRKMNETFMKFLEELEITPYCLTSFNHLRLELMNKRLWPLKFIDAMEYIPTGALEGVMSTFGLYEECINIESPMVKWNDIRGKYCMAKIRLPFLNPTFIDPNYDYDNMEQSGQEPRIMTLQDLNTYHGKKALMKQLNKNFDLLNNKLKILQMLNMFNGSALRIGLCFPSTCSSFELERAINKFLEPFDSPIRIEIEEECSVKDEEVQLDPYQKFALFVFIVLIALVVICTGYEYYCTNYRSKDSIEKNVYEPYLLTFSAISNTQYLLANDNDGHLCATDTIIMMFVALEFLGRSFVMPIFYGLINIKRALNGLSAQYFTAKRFFFIRGSSFAVSTYILCSAVVLAYNFCTHKPQIKPSLVNYLKYALNRYLSFLRRIIGPLLLLYLVPLAGDGPVWHYFAKLHVEPCKNNLLPTLFLFNNYASSLDEVCLTPSVISSALFWLSLTAPFILYAFHHKTYGSLALVLFIVIGSIISVIPKFLFDLPVTPYEISQTTSVAQAKLSFIHYYAATDQLFVVFCIGLFVGFLIKCKPKMDLGKRPAHLALWVGLMALPLISTSWNEGFKPLEGNFSEFSFTTWFVLSKIMWSFGFGWIIYTCCTGRAKPINEVVSLSVLRPAGKLAFGAFLNQYTVIGFRQLTKKEPTPLDATEIMIDTLADVVLAFILAYIFYIIFERPFYCWIRIILRLYPEQPVKRFSVCDLENGKINDREEIDLKPLNEQIRL